MKRPDYRTLQALDSVIRERGFERAAQKLCITQSAVSQRIKQLENLFGQPLLVRTVPPRPTESFGHQSAVPATTPPFHRAPSLTFISCG